MNRGQRSSSLHYAACFGRPAVAKVSLSHCHQRKMYLLCSLKCHLRANLRSGIPFVFVGAGKERLIQLLDYSSVASPQSGLFSDWSRNKRVLRTKP